MSNYIIGVDAGGSKTHAVLVDETGQVCGESFSGPANISKNIQTAYNSIITAIDELIINRNIDIFRIGVGVAGYSVIENRQKLEHQLMAKYSSVKLQSDCHIACLAAHGKHDGAIVICGTGVVAYTIKNGEGHQLGGWGYPHGDLGGGAWLGLEVCRRVCKAIDNIIPWSDLLYAIYAKFDNDYLRYKLWLLSATPRDLAEIARSSFILRFLATDINASEIFKQGVHEISQYIKSVNSNGLPIKLVGGVAPFYLNSIRQDYPEISLSETAPAFGAAFLVR
jgi:glucosamine kinase